MKVVSVVGARPQFIKVLMVSKAIREHHQEILVHTGQHYDVELSKIFFDELKIPNPDYNLEVGPNSPGLQIADMIRSLEPVLVKEKPAMVLVYGDTNSTLAGALTAAKLGIPLGHVEAGLRSFKKSMQEEINRLVTDHLSDYLFCPTETAVTNLRNEGIRGGVYHTGDVNYDAVVEYAPAIATNQILQRLDLMPKRYYLLTLHRAETVDDATRLSAVVEELSTIDTPVVFPVHPRTKKMLATFGLARRLESNRAFKIIEPVSYISMLTLEQHALKILTDSGGVQKEAYFFGVPCITLRTETEWVETLDNHWNQIAGSASSGFLSLLAQSPTGPQSKNLFGTGDTAKQIAEIITATVTNR